MPLSKPKVLLVIRFGFVYNLHHQCIFLYYCCIFNSTLFYLHITVTKGTKDIKITIPVVNFNENQQVEEGARSQMKQMETHDVDASPVSDPQDIMDTARNVSHTEEVVLYNRNTSENGKFFRKIN